MPFSLLPLLGVLWGLGWDAPAPGAMADAAKAETYARAALARHIATLAPGASTSDFVLVSNHTDGDQRSIGFVQHYKGLRVVGAQVSFRFKADRLFMIGNEARPNVAAKLMRSSKLDVDALRNRFALPQAIVVSAAAVIYPLPNGKGFRHVIPVTVDGNIDGKWLAYVDPATSELVASENLHEYATGTLLYRGVDRHPLKARIDRPARTAKVMIAGAEQVTGTDGSLTWSPDTPQTVATGLVGSQVEIINKGTSGERAATELAIAPNGQAVWDASANTEDDAQVVTFLAVNRVKDYVRDFVDDQLKNLDLPIKANVNINKSCNAFFDGATLNFFGASMTCQNTGLIEDVVFHEFGHFVHRNEIIAGVGRHDGAMSEGASDFLAAQITGDPGMGRGLFYSDEPLRHIDPPGDEFKWPDDISEIHLTGRIYSGAFWDLRTTLMTQLGAVPGTAVTNKLFVASMRRSVDIPSSFVEVLAADDNDGNLENGTPNECAIRDAFGRHGMRFATGAVEGPSTYATTAATTTIRFLLTGLSTRCTSDAIDRVLLIWVPGGSKYPIAGTTLMTAVAPSIYEATVPLPKDDVLYYSARVMFADGTTLTLADNLADRYYTLYQGETVPLYCTTFDSDPFAADSGTSWRTGTSDGSESTWAWNGTYLEQAGNYPGEKTTYVELPPIDIGQWSDVHLQYKRMLFVEDSQFDKARISVDGAQAWINNTANRGDSSSFHHLDREWRFHDVRVSGYTQGHTIRVAYELQADLGLELDGWNIDDVCVVANVNSVCGDGVLTGTESCDDGDRNANQPNTCRSYCQKPRCGDYIVDDKEECDHGPGGSKECTQMCVSLVEEAGCCSGSGQPAHVLFGLLLYAFSLRSSRRRRSRDSAASD